MNSLSRLMARKRESQRFHISQISESTSTVAPIVTFSTHTTSKFGMKRSVFVK